MIGRLITILVGVVLLQVLIVAGRAANDDHVHLKFHLPEMVQKHTQVKTILRHHFHPKRSSVKGRSHSSVKGRSHSSRSSARHHHHDSPESSYSYLGHSYTLPSKKAIPFPSFDFQEAPIMPPKILSNFRASKRGKKTALPYEFVNLTPDWAIANDPFSSYSFGRNRHHQRPLSQTQHTFHPTQFDSLGTSGDADVSDVEKSEEDDSYEDDEAEDEEYMITEDSIREQMRLRDYSNAMALQYGSGAWWNQDQSNSGGSSSAQFDPMQWSQPASPAYSPQQLVAPSLIHLQQMKDYEDMLAMKATTPRTIDTVSPAMLSVTKRPKKTKSKKRKRITSSNRKYPLSRGYDLMN